MFTYAFQLIEKWFNKRFGWFFTNGSKTHRYD